MNGNGTLKVAGFVLSVVVFITGSLAYLHGTFVTYREFTTALQALHLPATHAESGGIVEAAWQRALKLAKVDEEESAVLIVPRVWLVEEKHYIPFNGEAVRLCGYTRPTLIGKEVDIALLHSDVIMYMLPEEMAITMDLIVHEFLHHIYIVRTVLNPEFSLLVPDDEAWVRSVMPTECPAN